ncbi:hypothetical protein FHS27_006527 [Rhodopirellula rubra]|uniref:Type II secretion system protein GspE N-terminal domain-containing protein n=1 Tax=Aporhodopirellula rubra TaxID=980271 RepID=A0A7W5E6K8_9BACT|nr:hypothetical protein [Aporhodopirellula rubra]MBB3210679.1 hypothetical protein [Aporhodopirellula rubra]
MLNASDLDRIAIDEYVLEIVPETVARNHTVLPLSWDETTIHLIIPYDTLGRTEELLTTLRFILDRKLTYDVAERSMLETTVDLHYSAFGSVIQNCPRAILFRCNKRWVDLDRTGDSQLRHCGKCDTNVRLCKTGDELDAAVARGECVAYFDRSKAFLGMICDE